MKLIARSADALPGHLVEAGLDEFAVTDSLTTSVADINNGANISVYPNPFSHEATIEYSLSGNEGKLILTDLAGRILGVSAINGNKGTAKISSDLTAGIYIVKIEEKGVITGQVKLIRSK